MNVKFDQNGRILACGIAGQLPDVDNVIKVDDKDLPQDFLQTFAMGKYRVDRKEKRLVENKKFKMPERPGLPEEMIPPQAKQKRTTGRRKTAKSQSSSGAANKKKFNG